MGNSEESMSVKRAWLLALVVVVLVVAACGPQMATPTPGEKVSAGESPTEAVATEPAATQVEEPAQEPVSAGELPVDEDDWHVLGSPDAPVTIVEYSDFQ
jgi:protein-disulfide isomerase